MSRWELCAFNNLCKDKFQRLDMEWEFTNSELISEHKMIHLADIAKKSGVNPKIVHWSGSTRLDEKSESISDQSKKESTPMDNVTNYCSM